MQPTGESVIANRLKLTAICAATIVVTPVRAGLRLDSQFDDAGGGLPTMTIIIQNNGSTDPIFGWSLGLQVLPDGGSGLLEFDTATLPSTNYLFEQRSGGLQHTPDLPSSVLMPIFDSNARQGDLIVPSAANLLRLTFRSQGAQGDFQVLAVGNAFNGTNYTLEKDGVYPTVAFDNVPFDSSVVLGRFTVVPEPSAFALVAFIGIACACWSIRKFVRQPSAVDRRLPAG